MLKTSIFLLVTSITTVSHAADESLDEDFLVWLSQTADLDQLGMDIDQLIDRQKEMESQKEESQTQ